MIRIELTKNAILTNQAEFSNSQEFNSWFEKEKANGSFGKNERIYLVKDESELPKTEDPKTAIKIEPIDTPEGIKKRYTFPADYDVVITDITQENTDKFIRKKVTEARLFGNSLIDDLAFINVKNNRTSEEIFSILSDENTQLIIHLLQTGALGSAAILIKSFNNPMFTEQDKQMILDKIDAFFKSFQI
jgi:hypothetical protein